MRPVRFSRNARQDLDQIWHYIANESGSTDRADRVVASIAATAMAIGQAPSIGSLRDPLNPNMRGVASGNYLIYYRSSAKGVQIARVIHGKRDQSKAWS